MKRHKKLRNFDPPKTTDFEFDFFCDACTFLAEGCFLQDVDRVVRMADPIAEIQRQARKRAARALTSSDETPRRSSTTLLGPRLFLPVAIKVDHFLS